MAAEHVSDESLTRLPLFPLPEVVLFPGMALPLYVFEPRYREMIAHCLASDRVLAVARLRPGFEADYEGRPPVYPTMGAGFIVAHERLADGCYNIIVQGTDRVRVRREKPPERSFRLAEAERLVEVTDTATAATEGTLRSLLLQLAQSNHEAGPALARLLAVTRAGGALADRVAATTLADAAVRQAVLEELSVTARIERVVRELAELCLQGTLGDPGLAS